MESVRVSTQGLLDERLRRELLLPAGQTVAGVIVSLQLDSSTGYAALVNGRLAAHEYVLQNGDDMLLVELVSGG